MAQISEKKTTSAAAPAHVSGPGKAPAPVQGNERPAGRRNEKVGEVVSTKMAKTIVVAVEMRRAHPKYKRVIRHTKKFYAHDEQNSAHVGDIVRIRETRPLSKLKRWQLEEIIRRSSLAAIADLPADLSADLPAEIA